MDKKYYWLIGGILIGYVASGQISKLPVVNKLPKV
jgi:hypothetical protein